MDEDTGVFKLIPIANTQQRSIFDADFQQKNEDDRKDEDSAGSNAIEGKNIPMLPAPDAGEIIDGDYREVNESENNGEVQEDETEPGADLEDITDELLGDGASETGEDDGYHYEEPEDDSEE